MGIHPSDGDEAAHSVCLAFHGAKQFQFGRLEGRIGNDVDALAVDFETALDLRAHRLGHANEAFDETPVEPQPPAEGGASKRRQVSPLEAVAELAQRRRAAPAEQQPDENCDHGVRVARAKQDVGLVAADGADQVEHHPQGLERRGEPARPGEIVNQIVRRVMMLRTAVAPHGDADVLSTGGPFAGKPKRDALDSPGFKAV